MIRRVAGNVALAAAVVALMLLVLEGGARIARARRGGGREDNVVAQYTVPDPRLGWRMKPGARATYRRREYTVEVAANSRGLRDHERREGAPRVLFLGDSFVEGYTVPLEETLGSVAETDLGCADVVKAGLSGYSTDQEYLWYVDDLASYGARTVVVFVYYNDILYNLRDGYFSRPKPLLEPDGNGGLRLVNDPVPAPLPRPSPAARGDDDGPEGSALFEWVRERVQKGNPDAYARGARFGLWPPQPVLEPGVEMRVYRTGPTPVLDAAWQRTGQILAALRDAVAAHGATLLVVHVPNRFEVIDRDWDLTRRVFGMDDTWDRTRMRTRLAELTAGLRIPMFDLGPALRAANGGVLGEPYFVHDPHWNARGHAAAAHAVVGELRARGLAPTCR